MLLTILVDYYVAIKMEESKSKQERIIFLALSLFTNLSLLFTFKYFNLFANSTNYVLDHLNILYHVPLLKLLLPVGISFYTFQTLGYVIDVYKSRIPAEKHLGIFALYVSFFPQLVAGPIERAKHLIPQLVQKVEFNETLFREGLREILWGFFKKIVIADYLSKIVENAYIDPNNQISLTLILATYFFGIQIYCDFSGYSNIAIGSAKLFGINLMKNFDKPYFSSSIQEFWRRWHISLTTWFKDYIYMPLKDKRILAISIVFLTSGLWHGAKWTYVLWGVYHLIAYFIYYACSKVFKISKLQNIFKPIAVFITFHIVTFSWILFRGDSLQNVQDIIRNIFRNSSPSIYQQITHFDQINQLIHNSWSFNIYLALILVLILFTIEYFQDRLMPLFIQETLMAKSIRWIVYVFSIILILFFYKCANGNFIYFQF